MPPSAALGMLTTSASPAATVQPETIRHQPGAIQAGTVHVDVDPVGLDCLNCDPGYTVTLAPAGAKNCPWLHTAILPEHVGPMEISTPVHAGSVLPGYQ